MWPAAGHASPNTIKRNDITSSSATVRLGGVLNIWDVADSGGISYVIVEDNSIIDNTLSSIFNVEGHALAVGHSCMIRRNVIARNYANGNSFSCGAQIWNGTVALESNRIYANVAKFGGALFLTSPDGSAAASASYTLTNNLIVDNTGYVEGGGIYVATGCTVTLVNNTIANNTTGDAGGGMLLAGTATTHSKVIGINNIFWNKGPYVNEIYGVDWDSFHNNLIRGESSFGSNNFSADPQFESDGSYRLTATSPCIAAGTASGTALGSLLQAPPTDLLGNARPRGISTSPDLGAIEEDASSFAGTRKNRAELHSFVFGGVTRRYFVIRPLGHENETNRPVLMYLHGYDGTADADASYMGLHRYSDSVGYLTVYPEAYRRRWNSGIAYLSQFPTPSVDDVGFISALIDSLRAQYSIDTTKVRVVGFSNGGFMAQRLAATLAHRLAGVVAVSSRLPETTVSLFSTNERIPIMLVHGTGDVTVPYFTVMNNWRTVDDTRDFWRTKNGATTLSAATSINGYVGDNCSVSVSKYGHDLPFNSRGLRPVVWFYSISGGAHTWPGGAAWYGSPAIDRDIDLNHEIISFFESPVTDVDEHHSNENVPASFALDQNYPNPFNPTTVISYQLPVASYVSLKIFDLLGREVADLVNDIRSAGSYKAQWNAANMPSGVYFYRLQARQTDGGQAGEFVETRKMVLMR